MTRAWSASRSRWTDRRTCWIDGDEIAQVARRQYVALEGRPKEISLRVGYDGLDQVVDGLTGRLDRDAAAPLYQLGFASGAQPCGDPLWSPGASDVGENVTTCLVTSSAQRPYVAGLDAQGPEESFALNDALPEGAVEDTNDPQIVIFEVDPDRATGQFEVRTRMIGETEVTTGKKGNREKSTEKSTETFKALVAQGAFV